MPAGRTALTPLHSGARDFDFLYGTWKTSNPRAAFGADRINQIMDARVTVRPLAGGQLVADYEVVRGDSVKISGLGLMLYDAKSKQWAIRDARSDSALEPPAAGVAAGATRRFAHVPLVVGAQLMECHSNSMERIGIEPMTVV